METDGKKAFVFHVMYCFIGGYIMIMKHYDALKNLSGFNLLNLLLIKDEVGMLI